METINGAQSYVLQNGKVKVAITQEGGHLAPVVFNFGSREVSPYALAPWAPSEVDESLPILLKNLRGDFLCLPFGPQETGPPHGETANHVWTLLKQTKDSILLEINASDIEAHVEKEIAVKDGHTAIYLKHRMIGLEGDWNYGNHPVLDLSDIHGRISVSPFRWASVYPPYFSDPKDGATQALKRNARITDLQAVPLEGGGVTDLTHYPARLGNDDLVMMVNEAASPSQPFGWSAVVFDGYVWYQLKNPADFPATLLWLSNGGRSASPWNGRHTGRLGVEEVCSHFCDGVEISRQDLLAAEGIPTTRRFQKGESVSLRIIQGVAEIPELFGVVASIVPDGANQIKITDAAGLAVVCDLDWNFLI